jgi:hypothetical protein
MLPGSPEMRVAKRHYSAWDILGVLYWPRSDADRLSEWSRLMARTPEARRWARARRLFPAGMRPPRRSRVFLALQVILWLAIFAAIVLMTFGQKATLPGSPLGPAYQPHLRIGEFMVWAIVVAGMVVWVRYTASTLAGRALVVRRLREEGFVRRPGPAFAPGHAGPDPPRIELQKRLRVWARELHAAPSREQSWPYLTARPFYTLLFTGAYALLFLAMLVLRASGYTLLVIVSASIGVLVADLSAIKRLVRRARRALENGDCPDCGYELSGARGFVLPDAEGDLNLGPPRCPECGAPWPLLPPPVWRPPGVAACAKCRYDLTGLPADALCPECGHAGRTIAKRT